LIDNSLPKEISVRTNSESEEVGNVRLLVSDFDSYYYTPEDYHNVRRTQGLYQHLSSSCKTRREKKLKELNKLAASHQQVQETLTLSSFSN
jgi:hypothetical protein